MLVCFTLWTCATFVCWSADYAHYHLYHLRCWLTKYSIAFMFNHDFVSNNCSKKMSAIDPIIAVSLMLLASHTCCYWFITSGFGLHVGQFLSLVIPGYFHLIHMLHHYYQWLFNYQWFQVMLGQSLLPDGCITSKHCRCWSLGLLNECFPLLPTIYIWRSWKQILVIYHSWEKQLVNMCLQFTIHRDHGCLSVDPCEW